jgi:4-amino-4-deoxy-L-arabinose transferase-like glycosyltransferase
VTAPEVTPRRSRRWLAGICVLAVALRVGIALYADGRGLGFNDQFVYHHIADQLAAGDGYQFFGEPTLRWPPAYPFLLSLAYRLGGPDATWGFLLNASISAAAVPLVYLIGARVLDRRAALVAAGAVALLPGQWLFSATLLTEPLAALQLLAVLYVVVRFPLRVPTAVVLGALIGLAALTRGEGALLGLVPLVGYWHRVDVRRLVALLALAAVVAGAVVAPWAVRNARVAGEVVGLSLNSAETIWAGHNPTADGGPTYAPRELLAPAADVPFGPERELANARILRDDARRWAMDNPHRVVGLVPLKLLQLLSGDGKVVTVWIEAEDPALGTLGPALAVLADMGWYLLLAALVLALVQAGRGVLDVAWMRAALVLPAAALVLYGVVLYGNFRYRVPYQPVLALVAAPAALWLVRSVRPEAPAEAPPPPSGR